MLTLFVIIVTVTAILGFFSQEIIQFIKSILTIPGAILWLPILLASLLVENHLLFGWWGLMSLRNGLSNLEHKMADMIPFQKTAIHLARIILLTLLAFIPVCIAWLRARKNIQPNNIMFWAYRIGSMIWLVSVILLLSLTSI